MPDPNALLRSCPQFQLEARFAEAYKRFSPEMVTSELENKRKLQEIARRKQP